MSINFVTFSNYKYTSQQQKLNEFAKTLNKKKLSIYLIGLGRMYKQIQKI